MRELAVILGLILTVALSACANDPSGRAREQVELSRTAYMQCLERNPDTPAVCSDLKATFDRNMKDFMETTNPSVMKP